MYSYNPIPYGCVFYQNPAVLRAPVFKSLDPFGHTCTVTGTTKTGNAWVMDGDDKILVADSPSFDTGAAITVMMWMKTTTATYTDLALFGRTGLIFNMYLRSNSASVRFYITTASGALFASVADTYSDGAWRLLIGTFDSSLGSDRIKLSVNAGTPGVAAGYAEPITASAADVTLGFVAGNAEYLTGSIGEAWIHNRALSQVEKEYTYNKTKWRYS